MLDTVATLSLRSTRRIRDCVLCVKYLGHGPSEAGGKNMVDAVSHATQTHSKVRTRKEKEENNSFVCKQ